MELKNYFAQDVSGNLVSSASCSLFNKGTQALVVGLTSKSGATISNPFLSGADGLIQFRAPNGEYDLQVVAGPRSYMIQIQCNDVSDTTTSVAQLTEAARTSADVAQLAADVAQLASVIYDTTAAGLLATAPGGFFNVLSATTKDFLILYKNDAGAALEVKRYPSTAAVSAVADNFSQIDERAGYSWGVLDLLNRLGIGLTIDGKLDIGAFRDVVGHITTLEAKTPIERNLRTGYLWGVMDLMDRLALALDAEGNLINKGRIILDEIDDVKQSIKDAMGDVALQWSLRSGFWWGVVDAQDRLAIALDGNGDLINKGRNILKELDQMGDSKWITPNTNIATWGDSLSENAWQPFLRQLMPTRNIYNGGIGGQKSGQIARRQGGIAPMITIADNKIPASGSVVVNVDVPFLNNSTSLFGSLYGVQGKLTSLDGVHSFTRGKPGLVVEIDPITPFIKSSTEDDFEFRTTVIWAGNNDYQSQYRPEVDGNVSKMVDYLKSQDKHFIVIGMAIAAYSDRLIGTPYYTDTIALHKKWREKWPNNFIDITPILQRHYDPNNPTDVQNLVDGCTPSSLRVDEIHLNDTGKQIVAQAIYDFIIQRGW